MQLELQGEIEPFELSNNLCYKVLELVLLRIIDQFQVGQNFLVVHQIVRDHGWVVLYVQETSFEEPGLPTAVRAIEYVLSVDPYIVIIHVNSFFRLAQFAG